MPTYIIKPSRDEDFYVWWSTVVDAPIGRLRATVARCERLADSWTDRGWDSPPATDWRAQLHGAVFNPVGDLRAALAEPTGQEGDQ